MNPVLLAAAQGAEGAQSQSMIVMVVYIVIIGAFFYFMMVRPQKKEKERTEALMASLAVGDVVLTTSGFYGVLIDIDEDTVVVEFGGNRNCRIPMKKSAIAESEKPEK